MLYPNIFAWSQLARIIKVGLLLYLNTHWKLRFSLFGAAGVLHAHPVIVNVVFMVGCVWICFYNMWLQCVEMHGHKCVG